MPSLNEAGIYLLEQIGKNDDGARENLRVAFAIGETRKDRLTTLGNPYWEKYRMCTAAKSFYWNLYWTISSIEREMWGV